MTVYDAIYESRRRSRDAACGCQKTPQAAPPAGPDGRVLWPGESGSRLASASRGVELRRDRSDPEVDIDSAKGLGSGCRPWLKVERDEPRYEACMKIAEKIGAIDSPKKAFEILKEAVGSEDAEVSGFVSLDTHLYLRGLAEVGRGERDAVMFPITSTLRTALADGATAIILFHVHPTLYTEPSDADKEVTKAFEAACATVDILLLDHLVVGGRQGFFSFAEKGLLA